MDAALEGRKKSNPLRGDWELMKDTTMELALFAKFTQHHDLKKALLKTGESQIIEHTRNDNYWGDGGDGSGRNMLGQLLMKVRKKIRELFHDSDAYFPPWIVFPECDQEDMFWRMGVGEDYLYSWYKYYSNIDNNALYQEKFPEPPNWFGFYLDE